MFDEQSNALCNMANTVRCCDDHSSASSEEGVHGSRVGGQDEKLSEIKMLFLSRRNLPRQQDQTWKLSIYLAISWLDLGQARACYIAAARWKEMVMSP